jgi:YHS domain-containing protein
MLRGDASMTNIDQLSKRIEAEFADARRRIEELQRRAAREAESVAERYEKFERLRHHVTDDILVPRIQAMLQHFDNAKQSPHRHRFGVDLVIAFGRTTECPANVELKLSLTRDESIEQISLVYELTILPVFTKFEPRGALQFKLDEFDELQLTGWLEDRLVAFVQTYLSLQFVDQYQQDNLVSDPVASIRFPKAFAKATCEYQQQTYYFLSDASKTEFERDPTLFIASS